MAKLSKTELMALDLAIQVMKDEQVGIDTDAAAFIGGIFKVTKKVINVTKKATPVARVTFQVTPMIVGAKAASGAALTPKELDEEFGTLTVESLIALREAAAAEED